MKATMAGKHQRGVALALVVWFIAGMSLLVAGIVGHARVDARMTQVHLARAKAIAAGDGAINLAMAERRRGYRSSGAGPLISESGHRVGDLDVRVRLYPANGFINPNKASREVLTLLFAFSGIIGRDEAQALADNVVKWRELGQDQKGRGSKRREFYAIEDMLQVEGVTRRLLDGIRDYVVVGKWASGSVDWNASPQAILGLLETLNPELAGSVTGRRQNMLRTGDEGRGPTTGRSADGVTNFRADAVVDYGGRQWLRRRWLTSAGSGNSSLPWRVVRTEPPRVVEG